MPDLGSLIDAQAVIVDAWQRKVGQCTPALAAEHTKSLAVAIDKYATLKAIERDEPKRPPPPPSPMRCEP